MRKFEKFGFVNRTALAIKPKTPFNDWLQSIEANDYADDLRDNDVYLLPDYDDIKQMEAWLKKNFDLIFSEQLNQWYVDDSLWPQKRTFKMFNEWFDYWLCTMVSDTQQNQLSR